MTSSKDNPPASAAATLSKPTAGTRNHAVDFLRVAAMLAVAVGHWLAMTLTQNPDGTVSGHNALELRPQLSWITWLLQVMPLFFVVGGFASAMSLDGHAIRGGSGADWVADRLRRMCWPATALAVTWFSLLAASWLTPAGGLVAGAAAGAAIPLWFLANYTLDIAAAPVLRPWFKARPALTTSVLVGVYATIELLGQADVPLVHHVNWVVGWLLFQVLGYAWFDGLVVPGRVTAAVGVALWPISYAVVKLGPWPASMIHIAGMTHSPTHPPSVALVLFGLAYSLTAISLTPVLNRLLGRSSGLRMWTKRLGAMSMSVYLWHMTAAAAVAAVQYSLGLLDTHPVGSSMWWLAKVPVMAANAAVLAAILAVVSRFEIAGLLNSKQGWRHGNIAIALVAIAVSASTKMWASGSALAMTAGSLILVVASVWALNVRLATPVDRKIVAAAMNS